MQFKALLALPVLSGLAAAAPPAACAAPPPAANTAATTTVAATATATADADPQTPTFQVTALRSGSDIHFATLNAAGGNLYLRLPHSNATCDVQDDSVATFDLTADGELFLYSTDNPPQQLYADRSGMGQGKLGYITGAQPPPRNAELKGWEVDKDGYLTLQGAGFIACPNSSLEGAWSVWVSAGNPNPGGNKDCMGFPALISKIEEPNSCTYTA